MSKQFAAPLPQVPKSIIGQLTNGSGTNYVDLFAVNLGLGKNLQGLQVVSTSASNHDVVLAIDNGTTTVQIGRWTVTANLGNNGNSVGLDLMSVVSAWLNRTGMMDKAVKIKVKVPVALGAGETLDFYGEYMDLDDAA